nr:hypothetical protein BaRGS_034376 [Batillaria attramentaria]
MVPAGRRPQKHVVVVVTVVVVVVVVTVVTVVVVVVTVVVASQITPCTPAISARHSASCDRILLADDKLGTQS